jgi:hypothetical protein
MSGAAELVGSAGPSLSGMSVLSRSDAIEHTHTHTHTHASGGEGVDVEVDEGV